MWRGCEAPDNHSTIQVLKLSNSILYTSVYKMGWCHFKNTPVVVNNPIDNESFLKVD